MKCVLMSSYTQVYEKQHNQLIYCEFKKNTRYFLKIPYICAIKIHKNYL